MVGTVSKDSPLFEITLRKYEKPYKLSKRDLVKKLCLSFGLLQPGDSRDIIVDIFYIFLNSKKGKEYTISELADAVIAVRKQFKQPVFGVAESNIRRQLRRLRELYLIEKKVTKYRLAENLSISEIFEEKIKGFILNSIVNRVEDYIKEVDTQFSLE